MSEGCWLYETPVESDFEYRGYRCLVKPSTLGYRCGYAMLPAGHPLEAASDMVMQADVHGGVTFFECLDRHWVAGFDCAHILAGDAKVPALTPNYNEMMSKAVRADCRQGGGCHENFEQFCEQFDGHAWSREEVECECRRLVDELERLAGEIVIG